MTNVLVTGRVGTDPELRYTSSGAPVLNFQLAEDHRRYNEQTKEWEKQGTTWRSVSVWERGLMKPEYLHTVIAKGQNLTVQGMERLREWETQDGTKGKTLELSASLVAVPLYPPRENNAAPAQQAQPAQGAPAQPQQQVSAWPTAPAGGFAQQADPWAAQGGASEEPPF
ncbi:single-stranded DNA-binding protein [Rothia aeria]|uniref:single-stranded DNA-binding protein n=1 Tax=Rothia aeria TaxID=172042 RepID=UPI003C7CBDB0